MTIYFSDTFADADGTPLTSHTPDVGAGWSNPTANDCVIESNMCTNGTFAEGVVVATATPATADYQVSADLIANGGTTFFLDLLIRDNGMGSNNYKAGWDGSAGNWSLLKQASGIGTSLGTSATNPVTDPSTHALVLAAVGTTITLSVDGVVLITATDSTYSAAGTGGIDSGTGVLGVLSLDNFVISDVGVSPTVHSGLTGQGFITVSNPVGVEVDMTGIDASVGMGSGYPAPRYHIGSIGFSNDAVHYDRLHFLSQPSEVFACPFPTLTSIAYSFAAGITATITEIPSW